MRAAEWLLSDPPLLVTATPQAPVSETPAPVENEADAVTDDGDKDYEDTDGDDDDEEMEHQEDIKDPIFSPLSRIEYAARCSVAFREE